MIEPRQINGAWKLRVTRPEPKPQPMPASEPKPEYSPREIPPRPGATFNPQSGVWQWRGWIVPTDKTMMNYLRLREAKR